MKCDMVVCVQVISHPYPAIHIRDTCDSLRWLSPWTKNVFKIYVLPSSFIRPGDQIRIQSQWSHKLHFTVQLDANSSGENCSIRVVSNLFIIVYSAMTFRKRPRGAHKTKKIQIKPLVSFARATHEFLSSQNLRTFTEITNKY